VRSSALEHGVRASVSFWNLFLSVTFGTLLWDLHSICVDVLCCQRNVAFNVSGFGRRWSVLLQIYLSNCGQEAVSLQTAAQKSIFSTQPRRATKRVSWSCIPICQHRPIFASAVINGRRWPTWNCLLPNCARSTSVDVLRLHINWLMRECERIRDYTRALCSLCRCAIFIYLLTYLLRAGLSSRGPCAKCKWGPCPSVIFIYYRLYKVWPAALFRV